MAIGFTLPFARSSGSIGYFQSTTDELDAVKQNLRSLLLTNWGERVMHFYFGCNLREFLFTNVKDESLKEQIASRILEQVGKWMPFVGIETLNIQFTRDDPSILENQIYISIKFRLSSRPDFSEILNETVTQNQ